MPVAIMCKFCHPSIAPHPGVDSASSELKQRMLPKSLSCGKTFRRVWTQRTVAGPQSTRNNFSAHGWDVREGCLCLKVKQHPGNLTSPPAPRPPPGCAQGAEQPAGRGQCAALATRAGAGA